MALLYDINDFWDITHAEFDARVRAWQLKQDLDSDRARHIAAYTINAMTGKKVNVKKIWPIARLDKPNPSKPQSSYRKFYDYCKQFNLTRNSGQFREVSSTIKSG
jgi:hypothetical protein